MKVKPQILTGKQADGVNQLKERLWQGGQAYYSIMKHHQVNKRIKDISRKDENYRRKVRPKYGKKMTVEDKVKNAKRFKYKKHFQQRRKREIYTSYRL